MSAPPPERGARVVIGIDPGLLSGVAAAVIPEQDSPAEQLMSDEQPWQEAVTTVIRLADEWPGAVIVMEAFIITQATVRKTFEPWSLYSIGALEYAMHLRGRSSSTVLQSPATAKRLVDNRLLRALGLWHRGGAGHANDALRHIAAFALGHGWRPPGLVAPH